MTPKKCVQFVDREDIHIVVGASSLMPVLESVTIREVEFIHCHSYANIAAVRLRNGLTFSENVQSIYLCHECVYPQLGTEATVSGYGALMLNNFNVCVLRSVKVQIADLFECKKAYEEIGMVVSIQEICAFDITRDIPRPDGDDEPSPSHRRGGSCLVRHLQFPCFVSQNYCNQFNF